MIITIMKKLNKLQIRTFFGFFFLAVFPLALGAQTVLYKENFGLPTATTLVQQYSGWEDTIVVYTGDGTCDLRVTSASSGYGGASGGGNVMINDTVKWFQVSGLNTLSYTDLSLYCGLRKTASDDGTHLVVEVSGNGVSWTRLSMEDSLPSGTGTSGWYRVRFPNVPATSDLRIRFSNSSQKEYRLDDLALVVGTEEQLETVSTPTFSPSGGTYYEAQQVAITTTTAGAEIYYTLDGSVPTRASLLYYSPITLDHTAMVKAIAVADRMYDSEVATASYVILDTNSLVVLPLDLSDNSSETHWDITHLDGFRAYNLGTSYADGSAKFEASNAGSAALVAHLDSSPLELMFEVKGKKAGSNPSAYQGIHFSVSQSPDGRFWSDLITLTEQDIREEDYTSVSNLILRPETRYIRWKLDQAAKGNTQLNNIAITRNPNPQPGTVVLDYNHYPFALYPNPTSDRINLHTGGMHLIDLQLFDIYGHMVEIWEGNIPKTISLSHLPQGSYVLRVHTDEGFLYRKVVKY
jgi:hypothetical protein